LKYLKLYEKYIENDETLDEIKDNDIIIGKFVVLNLQDQDIDISIRNFFENNVGVITISEPGNSRFDSSPTAKYQINENIPEILKKNYNEFGISNDGENIYVKNVQPDEIMYIGNNKEELEILIYANKYNL